MNLKILVFVVIILPEMHFFKLLFTYNFLSIQVYSEQTNDSFRGNSPNFTKDGPDVEIAIVPPQEECVTDMDSKFR